MKSVTGIIVGACLTVILGFALGGCVSGDQARFLNIENHNNADNGSSIVNTTNASVAIQPYSDLNLLP